MLYYVIHKNPDLEFIDWAIDGPFEKKYLAEEHIIRCEYAQVGIEHRIVNENELGKFLDLDLGEDEEE